MYRSKPKPQKMCLSGSACHNQMCTFSHPPGWNPAHPQPQEVCKYDPHCTRENCWHAHPKRQQQKKPCINGADCFKVDCGFHHPSGWNPKANAKQHPCQNDPNCTRSGCHFAHPQRDAMRPLKTVAINCRHDPNCKRPDCFFLHPQRDGGDSSSSQVADLKRQMEAEQLKAQRTELKTTINKSVMGLFFQNGAQGQGTNVNFEFCDELHIMPVFASFARQLRQGLQGNSSASGLSDVELVTVALSDPRHLGLRVKLGYHGTKGDKPVNILHSGFDPTLRKGQVHGRGEYFDLDLKVATHYSGGDGCVVGTLIVEPEASPVVSQRLFPTTNSPIYIVDNPVNVQSSGTHCLPVFLLGSNAKNHMQQAVGKAVRTAAAAAAACGGGGGGSNKATTHPTFHFHGDKGWQPLDDAVAQQLEYAQLNGIATIYYTVGPHTYSCDVVGLKQTNVDTKRERQLKQV